MGSQKQAMKDDQKWPSRLEKNLISGMKNGWN